MEFFAAYVTKLDIFLNIHGSFAGIRTDCRDSIVGNWWEAAQHVLLTGNHDPSTTILHHNLSATTLSIRRRRHHSRRRTTTIPHAAREDIRRAQKLAAIKRISIRMIHSPR